MRRIIITAILLVAFTTAHAERLPYAHVSRAEAVMTLLSSIIPQMPSHINNGKYPDIIDGEWYIPYVFEAINRGILDSNPTDGLIHPHRPVTRAEFLKIMGSAFGIPMNLSYDYSDVNMSDWYSPYAGIAYNYQLFKSPERSRLVPNALLTHKEVSDILQIIFKAHPQLKKASTFTSAPLYITSKNTTVKPSERKYTTVSMVKRAVARAVKRNSDANNGSMNELVARINDLRRNHGLGTFNYNAKLSFAALKHSRDMWERRYFSHTTPEGVTYADRIRESGYLTPTSVTCACLQYGCTCAPYYFLGENLARGQLTVDTVLTDWMNSPSHRKNLLNSEFDEVGIGLFGNLWTITFGSVDFQ